VTWSSRRCQFEGLTERALSAGRIPVLEVDPGLGAGLDPISFETARERCSTVLLSLRRGSTPAVIRITFSAALL
jgi:hypothetical protein